MIGLTVIYLWLSEISWTEFHIDVFYSCFNEFFAGRLETHFSVESP